MTTSATNSSVDERIAAALTGAEVTVGYRDDAGDDAWATGALDSDEALTLVQLMLTDPAIRAALAEEFGTR